jgi:hypothetical protein
MKFRCEQCYKQIIWVEDSTYTPLCFDCGGEPTLKELCNKLEGQVDSLSGHVDDLDNHLNDLDPDKLREAFGRFIDDAIDEDNTLDDIKDKSDRLNDHLDKDEEEEDI